MISKSIKLISSILIIGLLTACSSKKDNISYQENKQNIADKIDNTIDTEIDSKLSNIQTIQTQVLDEGVSKLGHKSYYNTVTSTIDGKTITLTSIHFGFGLYKMNDEMIEISKENSKEIAPIINSNKNVKVKLEGNCDEWGNDEFNFALGLKRAKTVKDSLINNGINGSNLIILSLGEGNPICTDKTESCWKKNRRVDHRFIK